MLNRCAKALLLLLLTSLSTVLIPATALATDPVRVDAQEEALLTLINQHRAKIGVARVRADFRLQRAAEWMSTDMRTSNSLDHTDSRGRRIAARLRAFNYPSNRRATGETVAHGRVLSGQVFRDWLNSPVHRAVLQDKRWRAVGVGRVCVPRADTKDCWWTLDFGSRWGVRAPRA